jgi:hypothetical protein
MTCLPWLQPPTGQIWLSMVGKGRVPPTRRISQLSFAFGIQLRGGLSGQIAAERMGSPSEILERVNQINLQALEVWLLLTSGRPPGQDGVL